MKHYYLDHAATTPLAPEVLEAMRPYLETEFANPSSLYTAARQTRGALEQARHELANCLGAKPTEILFTSGGTESDNLAILGVMRAQKDGHLVTTAIEHDAILSCLPALEREGYTATVVPVKPNGIVAAETITQAITDDTVLVSVMLANNEIGTIQPVADIAKVLTRVRAERTKRGLTRPIYLHTDACQAAGYLDLHVTRMGVDLLTLNGSKIYGPKGIGLLYVRQGTQLEPLLYGGGQERGRRSGTENVAGAVGLAAALKLVLARREAESHRLMGLRDELIARLEQAIPEIMLNGDPKRRLPGNVNVTIPRAEGEGMVLYLDNVGIMASTGSACSTGSLDPSHVLLALGRSEAEANASLRFTLGRDTDKTAIDHVAEQLPAIVQRLRDLQSA